MRNFRQSTRIYTTIYFTIFQEQCKKFGQFERIYTVIYSTVFQEQCEKFWSVNEDLYYYLFHHLSGTVWEILVSLRGFILLSISPSFRNSVINFGQFTRIYTVIYLTVFQQQCEKYWGDLFSAQRHIRQGDIHISLKEKLELAKLVIRTFHIRKVSHTYIPYMQSNHICKVSQTFIPYTQSKSNVHSIYAK